MKCLVFLVQIFMVQNLFAANLAFDNLSTSDLEDITREVSSTFVLSTGKGASAGATIFGGEFGVVAGVANTPSIERIVANATGEEVKQLPGAALYAVVSLPFGFNAEANYIPEFEIDGFDAQNLGLGVRWNLNTFVDLPFDVAIKAHYSNASISFEQGGGGAPAAAVDMNTQIVGLQAMASKDLLIIEPYIGVGVIQADSDIDATASIFNFTTGTSASSKESGLHLTVGVEVNLLLLKTGLEYTRALDVDRLTAKIAFSL